MVSIQDQNGMTIRGRVIHRSSDKIILEITEPFSDVLMDISLPPLVSSAHSFKGSYGNDIIRFLLTNLYKVCSYTQENKTILMEPYRRLCLEISERHTMRLGSDRMQERCFYRKALFFHKWYPNMYVAKSSWDGLLAMLNNECHEHFLQSPRVYHGIQC